MVIYRSQEGSASLNVWNHCFRVLHYLVCPGTFDCSFVLCSRIGLTEKNTTAEGEIKEREFEAVQVKLHVCICLPSACMKLQVQLSVLKEEKRQILLQLRLEEAERNKRNVCHDSSAGDISGKMR